MLTGCLTKLTLLLLTVCGLTSVDGNTRWLPPTPPLAFAYTPLSGVGGREMEVLGVGDRLRLILHSK
jgi:hypothetical protein